MLGMVICFSYSVPFPLFRDSPTACPCHVLALILSLYPVSGQHVVEEFRTTWTPTDELLMGKEKGKK